MHTGFKTYTNTILYLTRSLTHSIFFFKLHKTTTTSEYRWKKNLSLHSYLFVLYHAQFNVHTLSYLSSCIDSAGSNFDVFFLLNAVFFYQNSDLNDSLTWVFLTIRRVFLWFHRNSYDVVDISSLFTHWICVWCFFCYSAFFSFSFLRFDCWLLFTLIRVKRFGTLFCVVYLIVLHWKF